jgi:hypothetical protein
MTRSFGTRLAVNILTAMAALVVLTLVAGRLMAEINMPGNVAQIEQLRKDVARAHRGENEDVIGQAAAWNQRIAAARRYRQFWWGRLMVPSGWDVVPGIALPEREVPAAAALAREGR